MKFIKRLFIGFSVVILLVCGFIVLCAFQPSLTQSLAAFLYGGSDVSGGDAGSESEGLENGAAASPGDVSGGESDPEVDENGLRQMPEGGYQSPEEGSIAVPENVAGRNGYVPVTENGQEVDGTQAEELQTLSDTGETGEGLTFDTSVYPYYGMLGSRQQELYRQIYANAKALNKSFAPIVQTTTAQLKSVFEAVSNDHPELFWLNTDYTCKFLSGGQCLEITLSFNSAADNIEQSMSLFQEKAEAVLSQASQLGSDYEKERYLHNALLKQTKYDLGADMNQSAYSALVNGSTVCAGYARAFQYLMQQAGIPCYYCTGYSGEDHAWNIVGLEGEYYNVDVTWDDTDPATYDYFNKTDWDFAATHARRGMSKYLPACGGETYRNLEKAESAQAQVEMVNGRMSLEELGYTQDMVYKSLESYYDACYQRLSKSGIGTDRFQLVVSEDLWPEVEASYSSGAYKSGYADQLVTELKASSFTFWIQGEELEDGSVLLTHVVESYESE